MTKPLTVERLERALDLLAAEVIAFGDRGRELLPMYKRLETELANMRAEADLMVAVRARLKQPSDQRGVSS
jgi:hypothetical protein